MKPSQLNNNLEGFTGVYVKFRWIEVNHVNFQTLDAWRIVFFNSFVRVQR